MLSLISLKVTMTVPGTFPKRLATTVLHHGAIYRIRIPSVSMPIGFGRKRAMMMSALIIIQRIAALALVSLFLIFIFFNTYFCSDSFVKKDINRTNADFSIFEFKFIC